MSNRSDEPLLKNDTSSESDGEVEKAEENLEHLKIEPKEEAKDDTGEMEPLDVPVQEETPLSHEYPLSEPAETSGLTDPRLTHTEPPLQDRERRLQELLSSSGYALCPSAEEQPPAGEDQDQPSAEPSKLYFEPKKRDLPAHYYEGLPSNLQTLAHKRTAFACDSANTSSDISEIRSEVMDLPTDDSIDHEATDTALKEKSPSVERQSSETSDKNVDMQEDSAPPPTPSGSEVSISTNTAEQGHQAYLARLQREADARGVPVSTSSGIGSTNQSELANLQRWGNVGYYRRNLEDIPDSPNMEISEIGAQFGEPQPEAGSMQVEQSLEVQRKQDCGGLSQQEQKESKVAGIVAPRMKVEGKIASSNVEEPSPSVRRKTSKRVSSSDSGGASVAAKLRPRIKPDAARKTKIAASKSATSQSSSESPDPKSSSSDELLRKDSPDIKSSSPSQSDRGKKTWQKTGQLRSMQLSALAPMDSVITEEDESQLSPRRALNPELMETKDASSPEKMETTPEKNVEGATGTEPTELKSSALESGDQACASEPSYEVSEFERSVVQTKRPGGKLSSSPPAEDKLSSTPPKETTSRPKKKARGDKNTEKTTRRTRTDSGGSVPKGVSLEDSSASTSTPDVSDYSGSERDDEEETAL